jgi:hypothetical protein
MNVRFAHTHDEKMQFQRRNATDSSYMHGSSARDALGSASSATSSSHSLALPLHDSLMQQLKRQRLRQPDSYQGRHAMANNTNAASAPSTSASEFHRLLDQLSVSSHQSNWCSSPSVTAPSVSLPFSFAPASVTPAIYLSPVSSHGSSLAWSQPPYSPAQSYNSSYSDTSTASSTPSPRRHRQKMDPRGPEGCNLCVHNLPQTYTEDDLLTLFSPFGLVLSVHIQRERLSSVSRGFGFVCFAEPHFAQLAITHLNETTIGGRQILVRVKGADYERRDREHSSNNSNSSQSASSSQSMRSNVYVSPHQLQQLTSMTLPSASISLSPIQSSLSSFYASMLASHGAPTTLPVNVYSSPQHAVIAPAINTPTIELLMQQAIFLSTLQQQQQQQQQQQ